ncbi:hypothetical protein AB1I68_00495 [Paenibacillus pabuli]|uniref:hypothetical protein n=1 Tax=Paenibacillus pabuli TaxID=1472 RepID=UPI00345A04D8
MKNALLKGKIIEIVRKNSPEFENEMNPLEIIQMLDRMHTELSQNPNEETAQMVREELQLFEVITIRNEKNGTSWITKPMTYEWRKAERSTLRRILYLLSTGTQWISKFVLSTQVKTDMSIPIPMMMSVQSPLLNMAQQNDMAKLEFSIAALKENITARLQSNVTSIGIFQKPDGVINMNLLNAWLEENKALDGMQRTNKNPLTLLNLDQIVDRVHFQLQTDV